MIKLSAFRLVAMATVLASSLVAIPADFAIAYDDGSAPANVGSLDDYVHQGQPRDQGYGPRGSSIGGAGQGYYGAPSGSRSQINPAIVGAMMLTLWALQRREARHQHHDQRHAMRDRRNSRRSRSLNSGNPMPSPFGYGF
jgi:hypothetical protein